MELTGRERMSINPRKTIYFARSGIVTLRGMHMGVVGSPKDFVAGRRKFVEGALKDLSPGVREGVIDILRAWEGGASERKLEALVGKERAKLIANLMREK
jgi:hypothetical protein